MDCARGAVRQSLEDLAGRQAGGNGPEGAEIARFAVVIAEHKDVSGRHTDRCLVRRLRLAPARRGKGSDMRRPL